MAYIRIRGMRLMSDSAYAYAYGGLYIYGPYALERSVNQEVNPPSKAKKSIASIQSEKTCARYQKTVPK